MSPPSVNKPDQQTNNRIKVEIMLILYVLFLYWWGSDSIYIETRFFFSLSPSLSIDKLVKVEEVLFTATKHEMKEEHEKKNASDFIGLIWL